MSGDDADNRHSCFRSITNCMPVPSDAGVEPQRRNSPAHPERVVRCRLDRWERGPQKPSGLQSHLPGSFFRRFLAHRTTMDRRIVEKLPRRGQLVASNVSVAQAPGVDEPVPAVWTKIHAVEWNLPSRGRSPAAVWAFDTCRSDTAQCEDAKACQGCDPREVGKIFHDTK